jgi:hypothetical protein
VSAVLRKVGQWIGLEREEWEKISGHSARVSAAQDLLALNISLASVMQAVVGKIRECQCAMRSVYLRREARWHRRRRLKVSCENQRALIGYLKRDEPSRQGGHMNVLRVLAGNIIVSSASLWSLWCFFA